MIRPSVLFVCLGNICRSPLAEGAFRAASAELGLDADIDSAGTGDWHLGRPPDPRAQAVALKNGIDISGLRARLVTPQDFIRFEQIVALDLSNLSDLQAMRPATAVGSLSLLLDHLEGREGEPVVDPYYGTDAAFDTAWAEISAATRALAASIVQSCNG